MFVLETFVGKSVPNLDVEVVKPKNKKKECAPTPLLRNADSLFSPLTSWFPTATVNTDWGEVHRGIATWMAPLFLETRSEKPLTS